MELRNTRIAYFLIATIAFIGSPIIREGALGQGTSTKRDLVRVDWFPKEEESEILLSSPRNIVADNEGLWVLDFRANLLVHYDLEGSVIAVHDAVGDGPGELSGPLGLAATDQYIVVISGQNQLLNIYTKDDLEIVDSFKLTRFSSNIEVLGGKIISENSYFIDSELRGYDYDGKPLLAYDLQGKEVGSFGDALNLPEGLPTFSYASLCATGDGYLMRVPRYYPLIQRYAQDGKLISSAEWSTRKYYDDIAKQNYDKDSIESGRQKGYIPLTTISQSIDCDDTSVFVLIYSRTEIVIDKYDFEGLLLSKYVYEWSDIRPGTNPLAWDLQVSKGAAGEELFIVAYREQSHGLPIIGIFKSK